MHTLTKADLTSTLVTIYPDELHKDTAQKIVEDFFKVISGTLASGEEVKVSGLGRFALHQKRERIARNPKTGASAVVSARRVVSFLPSVTLKAKFEMLATLSQQAAVSKSGVQLAVEDQAR